jgi:hypothetical protein
MDPARDDLDERLRQAARPDDAAVERVVVTVLGAQAGRRAPQANPLPWRRWPAPFAVASACLLAAVVLGVWWCAQAPAPAMPAGRPNQVFSVTADDGTTWIFSSTPSEDWLPPGTAIVIGGEEAR